MIEAASVGTARGQLKHPKVGDASRAGPTAGEHLCSQTPVTRAGHGPAPRAALPRRARLPPTTPTP